MGFDQIAEALGARARRQVLVELLDHNPVGKPILVTKTEAREHLEREVQLVHVHLPKLEAMGYIVWDDDNGNILKGPHWEEIEPVVRFLSDNGELVPDDTF